VVIHPTNQGSARKAALHEAGHLTVALHFRFPVLGVESDGGKLRTLICFDWDNHRDEGCVVLAAGAAAEKLSHGHVDPEGNRLDVELFREVCHPAQLEHYITRASTIIEGYSVKFNNLTSLIADAMLHAPIAHLTSAADDSEIALLVSGTEITDVWMSQ